jgi:putative transposase
MTVGARRAVPLRFPVHERAQRRGRACPTQNGRIVPRVGDWGNLMRFNPDMHHRRSIRLMGYDYSRAGAYFVTVCTQQRACLFGEVAAGRMLINDAGRIVRQVWDELPNRFSTIALDAFVVMPNHVHGTIVVVGAGLAPPNTWAPPRVCPVQHMGAASSAPTVSDIVRAFKSISAIRVNRHLSRSGQPLWQRNYYERIIRDEDEMGRIREYIATNPAHWAEDDNHTFTARPHLS